MIRWAYQTIFLEHTENFDKWANKWGEQGWEIYQVSKMINAKERGWGRDVFMKRSSTMPNPCIPIR
jgi:hypothetical protein